jgi:hypothetical protein
MEKITSCICRSDNVENFPHVIEDGGSLGSFVIILVSTKPMLDFGERLLDRIEVWRIRRKVLNSDT